MSYAAAARYQELDLLTMSRERRVVLVYGHVVAHLRQGIGALDRGDIAARARHLLKAWDLIALLLDSLDLERGGEIAANLAQLYRWMLQEIAALNAHPDRNRLERVLALNEELYGAWQAAAAVLPGASSR
jgi:flagellar protein FliS